MINKMFDISEKGFIPTKCLNKCPDEYKYLDDFLEIRYTISIKEFRDKLNIYIDYTDRIEISRDHYSILEIQKIYSSCSILAHYYVWGGKEKIISIPSCISVPWYYSSKSLGIATILTHAAVDLYNWRIIDESKGFSLDNVEPINFFNQESDIKESEKWFYLPMIAIEGECGKILYNMSNIYEIVEFDEDINTFIILNNLKIIQSKLERQYEILKTTRNCKPEHFYHNVRPYLGGSNSDKGWYLEGIGEYIKFDGGSAAQSSLIQAEDIFFEISHNNDSFLLRMREYMPENHKSYLEYMEIRPKLSSIKSKICSKDWDKIDSIRNECVNLIHKFRKFHFGIVQDYVKKFNSTTGTGGTNINDNLKQYIKNTGDSICNKDEYYDDSDDDFDQYEYLRHVNPKWIILFIIIYTLINIIHYFLVNFI